MPRLLFASCLAAAAAFGAEGGASITPAPGFEPRPSGQPQRQPMARPAPVFEVERLVLGADDPQTLVDWAALAAVGFRVVSALPMGEQTVLLLERSHIGPVQVETLRLPQVLDATAAMSLRQRIAEALAERQRPAMPQRPTPAAPGGNQPGGRP